MATYENYNEARLLWLESIRELDEAAKKYNETYETRNQRWRILEELAASLSPEEQEQAKLDQFPPSPK